MQLKTAKIRSQKLQNVKEKKECKCLVNKPKSYKNKRREAGNRLKRQLDEAKAILKKNNHVSELAKLHSAHKLAKNESGIKA